MKSFLQALGTILLGVTVIAGSVAVWLIDTWSAAGQLGVQTAIILIVSVALFIAADDIKKD